MIPIQLIIIVYLLSIFLQNAKINSIESENWCHNQSAVLCLQREQLRRARISVFGEKHHGFLSQSENLNLYKHINNKYTVKLSRNANGYSHLIYRRLFKNANDHIRTLLYNYEQRLCKGSSKLNDKILKCIPNCDFSCPSANSYLNIMMKRLSTLFLSAEEKNFSFTFVREPLSRFISGMTEIEYRIQKNPSRQKFFEFKNELGSFQRFQEFVDFLLLHGDFRTFVDEHFNVEIAHIAPMIGTILPDPAIHLYRIEDFNNELRRLAQDVGQPDLYDLHVLFGKRNLAPHNSSHDEFNISITSKSFLAHASRAARSYFFPSSSSSASSEPLPIPAGEDPGEYQQQAAAYLVALCRIFLTDFLCAGGYELPQDCAFLRGEALELLEDSAGGAVANPSHCSDGRSDDDDPLCGLNVEQEVVEGCIPSSICDGQKCWEIFV